MNRKELRKVLDTIIAECETTSAEGRQKAFERCLDYADRHLGKSLECNLFLAWAAERLGQSRVMKQVVQEMVNRAETARLHVGYQPDWGMVLTGNAEGLKYLSDLLSLLAEAPVEGEFIKMEPEDEEIIADSFGLIVFREDEDWFEAVEEEYELQEDEDYAVLSRRKLDPGKVFGLQFLSDPPAGINVQRNKVYIVQEVKKRTSEEIFEKLIREDSDNLWVFSFNDDNYDNITLALDLEDPDLNFLTRADMAQIIQ